MDPTGKISISVLDKYCKTNNVGCTVTCQTCKSRKVDKSSVGVTCKNTHIKGKEPLKDLEMKNVLYRHIRNDHKEEEDQVEFKMKVVGKQNTDELQTGIYRPAVHRRIIEGKQKFIFNYRSEQSLHPCVMNGKQTANT